MADPQTHAPTDDSDAISFGEMSSEYDSADEASSLPKPKPSDTHDGNDPTLNNEFDFSGPRAPNLEHDGFEFIDADPASFPDAARFNAEQESTHTMHGEDEQPNPEYASFHEQAPRSQQAPRPKCEKGALGVLYCGTCDRYFGNEKVFKRHFMFGIKHAEEPRDMKDLYYRVWGTSWADEVRDAEKKKRTEVDVMEL